MKFPYLPLPAICLGVSMVAASAASLANAAPQPKKLLVVTHTTGFRHDSIPTAEKVLAEMGEKSGVYSVVYCRTGDDVKLMLTPEWLNSNHIDGVFFANTTGNLGIPNLHAFLDWIKAGHAYLGAHSAGDTYHPKDADGDTGYIDMVGAEFLTHNRQAEAECIVQDPKHPATAHLPNPWKITDEIYHYKVNHRPELHVLLYLKTQPNDGVKDESGVDRSNQPTDMLISWTRMYGNGRVFYTALGHRIDVWENPTYQQHLMGGIRWALGLAKGDSKPQGATQPK